MKVTSDEIKQRMNQLKDVFHRSGLKMTHQRIEIFRELAKSDDHPDAETVFRRVRKRIPTVSLDTVYRTSWMLIDLGLVTTMRPPQERERFDANMSAHHHFVCSQCGKVCDFYCKEYDVLKIPESVKLLGNVKKTYVELRGICLDCSQKQGKK